MCLIAPPKLSYNSSYEVHHVRCDVIEMVALVNINRLNNADYEVLQGRDVAVNNHSKSMHGGSLTFLLRMLDCPQLFAEVWCRVHNEHLLVTSVVGQGSVVDIGDWWGRRG